MLHEKEYKKKDPKLDVCAHDTHRHTHLQLSHTHTHTNTAIHTLTATLTHTHTVCHLDYDAHYNRPRHIIDLSCEVGPTYRSYR